MSATYPNLNTVFPEAIDTFINNLDIQTIDADKIKAYQTAIETGNFVLAQQILNQIPNAVQKILTASKLNKFNDCITAVEKFYGTDIKPYINQKQSEWQSIINEFNYQGVYNPTTQYEVNNYVTFTTNGVTSLYIVTVKPSVGTSPTNTGFWRVLTIRGAKGDSGSGMAFMGDWSSTQNYNVMDCVDYENALWGAVQTNINQPPYESSPYWQLIYAGSVTIYPVTVAPPTAQENGALWFRVVT